MTNRRDVCEPDEVSEIVENGEVVGITVEHIGQEECDFEGEKGRKMGFKYSVLCDETITGEEIAFMSYVDIDDRCRPHVTLWHSAGCHNREVIKSYDVITTKTIIETEVIDLNQISNDDVHDNTKVKATAKTSAQLFDDDSGKL